MGKWADIGMLRHEIEVFIIWFVVVRPCVYTHMPDLDRDVYKECFTQREAEEALGDWMANDVPVPDDYYYAYIDRTSRFDD